MQENIMLPKNNNYLFEVCKMNFIRRGLQCKNRGREPEVFM